MAFHLTPEHKAKMAAGRQKAREKRMTPASWPVTPGELLGQRSYVGPTLDKTAEQRDREAKHSQREFVGEAKQSIEFLGLTEGECPIDCTPERCVIGGTLHFRNADGTVTKEGVCCHPNKAGLGPIQKSTPEILSRYNRARRLLEHMKIERDLK